jgi:hypothetical protein
MPNTSTTRTSPAMPGIVMGTTTTLRQIQQSRQQPATSPAPRPAFARPAMAPTNPGAITPRWAGGYGSPNQVVPGGSRPYDSSAYFNSPDQRVKYTTGTRMAVLSGLGGLGDISPEFKQIITTAPAIAGGVVTAIGTSAASAATSAGVASTSWATAAIPFVGPIVAGVTIALTLWLNRKGPKQKVATTKIVEEIEPLLKENVQGYLNGPRTRDAQAQALNNFDGAWQWVLENCGQPAQGKPGVACIADRQAGACKYQENGQCWNWFIGYRDPIANDPDVKPNPAPGVDASTGNIELPGGISLPGTVSGIPTIYIGAGIGLLLLLTMVGGDS